MRDLTAQTIAQLQARHANFSYLFQVDFDSGTSYFSTWDTSLEWDGNIYLGEGQFLAVRDLSEVAGLEVQRVKATLSGIDQSMIAQVLLDRYIGRTARIYQAFIDDDMQVIPDPILFFEGYMDSPSIEDDIGGEGAGTSSVTIVGTNVWADWQHPRGRRTSHDEQQLLFPGDNGFLMAARGNVEVTWGVVPG